MRIWLAIGGAALAWGTTGVATRAALNDGVPPVTMVAIRAVIAAVILYGLLRLRRRPITSDRYRWTTGLIAGVFQLSTPFILFTLAYQYASAGFGGLFAALIPLATAVLAHFLLPDERLHGPKVVGLLLAFGGVAVLLISGDSGLATGGRPLAAAGLSLGAVLSVAFAGVITKRRGGSEDPLELTFMQFLFGVALIGGAMLISEGMPSGISAWGWALVVYLAIFGSIVPFLLFYWVLSQVSSTQASLIGYVVPLVAIVAGIVLLDERLQVGIAAGGVLILVGVVLTDRSERARLAHT
jgi:drug/metabolite transporter (DMT)-like permease